MNNQSLTDRELSIVRDISIHKLIGIHNNGRKVNIKCVFHSDDTPSLLIDTNNGYHCFGCEKSGHGAIDFVMDLTDCSFIEAVEELLKEL